MTCDVDTFFACEVSPTFFAFVVLEKERLCGVDVEVNSRQEHTTSVDGCRCARTRTSGVLTRAAELAVEKATAPAPAYHGVAGLLVSLYAFLFRLRFEKHNQKAGQLLDRLHRY